MKCEHYALAVRDAAVDEARGTPRARSQRRRGARCTSEVTRRCTLFRGPPAGSGFTLQQPPSPRGSPRAAHTGWRRWRGGPRRTVDRGGPRPCAPCYFAGRARESPRAPARHADAVPGVPAPAHGDGGEGAATLWAEEGRVICNKFPAATRASPRQTPRFGKWMRNAADEPYERAAEGGSGCDSAIGGSSATMDDRPARMRRPASGSLSGWGRMAAAAAAAEGSLPELANVATYGRHRRLFRSPHRRYQQ